LRGPKNFGVPDWGNAPFFPRDPTICGKPGDHHGIGFVPVLFTGWAFGLRSVNPAPRPIREFLPSPMRYWLWTRFALRPMYRSFFFLEMRTSLWPRAHPADLVVRHGSFGSNPAAGARIRDVTGKKKRDFTLTAYSCPEWELVFRIGDVMVNTQAWILPAVAARKKSSL